MARARTDVDQIRTDVIEAIAAIREAMPLDPAMFERWALIESFVAVALRVFERTNPSKIRDAAVVEEIKARMDGRGVYEADP